MEKIKTTVTIAGKDYTLSGYDSEEYVRRVAIYVDRKLREFGIAAKLPAHELAVLTAVNIADDMFKAHDENTRLRKELLQLRQENLTMQKDLIKLKSHADKP